MNSGTIVYSNLEELSKSIYQLTDGEADIKGWPVRNEAGDPVGKVRDLLFDPEQNAIRYVIVELADMGEDLEEKAVLIPIGLVNLGEGKKEVILPDIHHDQFRAMPRYIIGEVTPELENQIRNVIGSPAALRMEDEIVEIDCANFYRHHHFDKNSFPEQNPRNHDSDPLI
ncbi:PRC-barrel domain-containing protein [Pedobacter sp. MR2016-19]|uniref:PRC-barrel domain-containing protein n=1 Tax=Pedobacter sp. MR2016-19 TaxID=2780089 RepID=UPI001875AC04|nr:PRC-barrel domain-containing protein [Pedobacter sp. MR2016-19]MBE5318166.1 PRC-barrel domain-containing protein [Pedobacter sp. MR2016-19]